MSECSHPGKLVDELSGPFIRVLPQEIISEIFIFCLPTLYEKENALDLKNHPFPLRLGAICSAWRRVAWATPTLWATVRVRFADVERIPKLTQLLKEWLSRSGHLPLTISLESGYLGKDLKEAILVISEYTIRWHYIDIKMYFDSGAFVTPKIEDEGFPMLKSLRLESCNYDDSSQQRYNFNNSPQLTHLTLIDLRLESVKLPWKYLTSLSLRGFFIEEMLATLRQTPRLVELDMSGMDGSSADRRYSNSDFDSKPIHLPFLTNLWTSSDGQADGELRIILRRIIAPALLKMSIDYDYDFCSSNFLPFLTQSKCPLEELYLSDSRIRGSELLHILAIVPSLKHLSVNMPKHYMSPDPTTLTDNVIQRCNATYTRAAQVPFLLPCLEVLTYSGRLTFSWRQFIQMICSRMMPSTLNDKTLGQLKELNLHLWFSLETERVNFFSQPMGVHPEWGVKLTLSSEIFSFD